MTLYDFQNLVIVVLASAVVIGVLFSLLFAIFDHDK